MILHFIRLSFQKLQLFSSALLLIGQNFKKIFPPVKRSLNTIGNFYYSLLIRDHLFYNLLDLGYLLAAVYLHQCACAMSIQYPILLWISAPFLGSGGMANHMINMTMGRSIPLLTSAFQALTAGCISGGAVVPVIWRSMRKTLDYEIIFGSWLILGAVVTVAKTI